MKIDTKNFVSTKKLKYDGETYTIKRVSKAVMTDVLQGSKPGKDGGAMVSGEGATMLVLNGLVDWSLIDAETEQQIPITEESIDNFLPDKHYYLIRSEILALSSLSEKQKKK